MNLKPVILVGAVLAAVILLSGCTNLPESVQEKSVNAEFTIYGMTVETSDVAANGLPTGKFGFGSARYRSVPMDKGQPFYVYEKIGSMWSDASETTIWIGRASEPSVLTYEAVPNTMISVSGTSVSSGESTVSVTSNETGEETKVEPVVVADENSEIDDEANGDSAAN